MTDDELAAIKARCDSATPGPWEAGRYRLITGLVHKTGEIVPVAVTRANENQDRDDSDAIFIAHSRQDIPALLAHVEAQAARIKALETRIQKESEERRLRV